MASTQTETQDRKDERKTFFTSLSTKNLAPLWTVMEALSPKHPSPKATPTVWRYAESRPDLIKAGQTVTAEEAERRVLMLVNPAMGEYILDNQLAKGCSDAP